MTFKVTHKTDYSFDSEVFLEPHYFRFRPKATSYLDVVDFSIKISPEPKGIKTITDEENNGIHFCYFEGVTENLSITAETTLEVAPYNPFDFILYPNNFNTLPFRYNKLQEAVLHAALKNQPLSKDLMSYVETIQKASSNNTISFLSTLTQQLHDDFIVEYRESGAPFSPNKTFQLKRGSCRDLAWMLISLLRHQGIAARFVSGYFYFDMDEPAYELHAWAEVFLPGTGWLGVDPSHGIFTGNSHFPIAASSHYDNTMPVSGGIRGHASSKLNTQLSIEII